MKQDMGDLPALAEAEPVTRLGPSGFDPARSHYRSQGYAMTTIDTGRDPDGAPISEVWAFANEDDYSLGDGWLELRIHEVVDTERSGTLVVYYKQWFAPDGQPVWGGKPRRKVGSLGSVKAIISRRKMTAIAMEARQGRDGETRLDPKDDSAGRQASPKPQ